MAALWEEDECQKALRAYVADYPAPRAIVVVSAHGVTPEDTVEVTAVEINQLEYDFRGFPGELYQIEYPCPGSPSLAVQIAGLLGPTEFRAELNTRRLDHGVWIPVRALYPSAQVPVVQVSLPYPTRPEKVLLLGKTLAALRNEGVLLIGSGGLVHNLEKLNWSGKNSAASAWGLEFNSWVRAQLQSKDIGALVNFEEEAPHAELAHPTPEHFLPLFFTLGSSLTGDELDIIFEGFEYGSLSMDCLALREPVSKGSVH